MFQRTLPCFSVITLLFLGVFSVSSVSADVIDRTVSNLRNSRATVSWQSTTVSNAYIDFGTTPLMSRRSYDVRGQAFTGRTHYFDLNALLPSTTYFYQIFQDGQVFDSFGSPFLFTTGPDLTGLPPFPLIFTSVPVGNVAGDCNVVIPWTIVHVQLTDANGTGSPGMSAIGSDLIQGRNGMSVDLINLRTQNLAQAFATNANQIIGDTLNARYLPGGGTQGVYNGPVFTDTIGVVMNAGDVCVPFTPAAATPTPQVTPTTSPTPPSTATPTPSPTATPSPTPTIVPTAPTSTPTESPTPSPSPTVTPEPVPLVWAAGYLATDVTEANGGSLGLYAIAANSNLTPISGLEVTVNGFPVGLPLNQTSDPIIWELNLPLGGGVPAGEFLYEMRVFDQGTGTDATWPYLTVAP